MILVVSTHADDAAFSCGEFIARQTSEGEEVVVVNVCSTAFMYDLEGQEWQRVLNAEHIEACKALGAGPAFGERQDGKWGTPLSQQNVDGLFVADLINLQPDIFLIPLGIHHQDHLDVHHGCMDAVVKARDTWGNWHGQVYVYEDLPYAPMWPEEAQIRRGEVFAGRRESVANAGFLEQKLAACRCYESQWSPPEGDAPRCCSVPERIWSLR